MNRLSILAAAMALAPWASASPAGTQGDVYARAAALKPGDRTERLLLDARFGKPGSIPALRAALAAEPRNASLQARGWRFLCSFSYHVGRYHAAIADCTRAMAADPSTADDSKDTLSQAKLFARLPPPRLHGRSARLPIAKSGRIDVRAGDEAVAAVPDTGAEISVMMQSVADKAHVRILGPSAQVNTTTAPVHGNIGVIPRLEIGKAVLTDVPVLVLPDARLTFDEGRFTLPFILGLYSMREFGRVAWLDRGTVLALGDAAPELHAGSVPVFWHPLGIGVPLDGPRGRRAAHFDTGADRSFLYPPALAILSAAQSARAKYAERKIGGVGGIVTQKVRRLPAATFELAGQKIVLTDVDVAPASESGEAARIGSDVFKQLGTVVLDFRAMRLSARPPAASGHAQGGSTSPGAARGSPPTG